MHQNAKSLVMYMCLTLLFLQWSGMHFHVSAEDFASELHVGHIHTLDQPGQDHDHYASDFDVSLFELAANWLKQIQNVFTFTLALILFVSSAIIVWPPPFKNILYHRHAYWRPTLRGPPSLP